MKKKQKPQGPHMEPFLFFFEPFLLLNCAWTVVVRRDGVERIFFLFKK